MNFQNELLGFISNNQDLINLPNEIKPAGTIPTSEEALDIHRQGYIGSLINAMSQAYGKIKRTVGEDTFSELVTEYILENPSKNWDINHYGRTFPKFLKDQGLDVLSQLAQLELLFDDVSNLKKHSIVTREKYLILDKNPDCRVILASTLTFFESDYSISDLWFNKVSLGEVKNSSEKLILYRKGASVVVRALDHEWFELLRRLRQMKLSDALSESSEQSIQDTFLYMGSEGLIEDIIE